MSAEPTWAIVIQVFLGYRYDKCFRELLRVQLSYYARRPWRAKCVQIRSNKKSSQAELQAIRS